MEVNSTTFTTTRTAERTPLTEEPGKVKTTEELQQQAVQQAQVEKSKKTETKKVEDNSDKDAIRKELTELAAKLNDEIAPLSNDIRFGFSDEIEQMMVNVIDANTGDVIRQFPSKEAIQIMTKMKELIGMLFDKKG
jgi:flagellar protein FlaG